MAPTSTKDRHVGIDTIGVNLERRVVARRSCLGVRLGPDGRAFLVGDALSKSYETGEFLLRYRAGEHEAVWRDMTALGAAVRGPPYFDDAWATARETMKRAARNVRTIIQRLDGFGYAFWNGEHGTQGPQGLAMSIGGRVVAFNSPMDMLREAMARSTAGMHPRALEAREHLASLIGPFQAAKAKADAAEQARIQRQAAITDHLKDPLVFAPPTADEVNFIRGLETKGMFLPLSLRAWVEEVGDVNLAGSHPTLCFWDSPGARTVYADPLMVTLDHFNFEIEAWQEQLDDGEEPEGFDAIVAWDPQAKARLAIEKQVLDDGYSLAIPDSAADGHLSGVAGEMFFVDYLRKSFRWGGFPGWEGHAKPPEELQLLTESLLPI